jgi:hypothetical protein
MNPVMKLDKRTLAIGHGLFYVASGLWPVFHMKSFEQVTGPKTDHWLVKTVGLLIAVTGGTLLQAGLKKEVPPEATAVGAGHASVLGAISGWYGARGRISRIYLLDSAVELALAGAWLALEKKERAEGSAPGSLLKAA